MRNINCNSKKNTLETSKLVLAILVLVSLASGFLILFKPYNIFQESENADAKTITFLPKQIVKVNDSTLTVLSTESSPTEAPQNNESTIVAQYVKSKIERAQFLAKYPAEHPTQTTRANIISYPYEPSRTNSIDTILPTYPRCPLGCRYPKIGCDIKGNISFSTNERIYHLPGQAFYDKTEIDSKFGELWFCTEEEAVANGWRKAKR